MASGRNGAECINSFALVAYIPDPLGQFLDDLRRELVPDCVPRAHVTLLPPRPLVVEIDEAWQYLDSSLKAFPSFEVRCGQVQKFQSTSVIYIGLDLGRDELEAMHTVLNQGPTEFQEPFQYHPHITLAQDLAPERVKDVYNLAIRRWVEYNSNRSFVVDGVTFVQGTNCNQWIDLAHFTLRAPQPV